MANAVGCVTAVDVVSPIDVPGFDNSAMDGFAVLAIDTVGAQRHAPVLLEVVDTVNAGAVASRGVGRGAAVRIMTGAPMPGGADAVVPVEHSSAVDGDRVELDLEVAVGSAVRRAGDDLRTGDIVVAAGTVLRPAHIGVLASIGCRNVEVIPRPRVGVISTGDELIAPGQALGPGQIHDSNRPMLLALVSELGADAIDLGHVADDANALEAVLRSGVQSCDVVISSGGVSMGDADVVKLVLGHIAVMDWMQIAIKPAKPFALGMLDGTAILGLPGNPVSSLVSFELLARPALRSLAGRKDLDRPMVRAVAGAALARRGDGKVHYLRVAVAFDGTRFSVMPAAAQGSHQLSASASADGLAIVADGSGVAEGELVDVLLLGAAQGALAGIA